MRERGLSLAQIANILSAEGYRMRTGARSLAIHIKRILDRQGA